MPAPASIISTFDVFAENWDISGDVASSGWATLGDPGGCMSWIDAVSGDDAYWVAPAAQYAGDRSDFFGGTFSYDIKSSEANYAGAPDVILSGGGLTLVVAIGQPGEDWTHFKVRLSAGGGWKVGSLDGEAATNAQIHHVLASLDGLSIRAEYVNGGETGQLDNVAMIASGGSSSTWNLYAAAAPHGFQGAYADLTDAMGHAAKGMQIAFEHLGGDLDVGTARVTHDALTIEGDAALSGRLRLGGGVADLTLAADNSLDVIGNGKDNHITGSDGDNRLTGGGGQDVLSGGLGVDLLDGGSGLDAFVYGSLLDSPSAASDKILHFSHADGDQIDLGGLSDGELVFRGHHGFQAGVDGQVRILDTETGQRVLIDIDGDRHADMAITIVGGGLVDQTDFVL
jgi:Ca2+-binding RTX toxin-like protein